MVSIVDKDGVIILYSEEFELKIDNNRQIYIKKKDENQFSSIGEVERGLSVDYKKKYLYNLHNKVLELLKERKEEQHGERF